jgi:hypothetical protein
MRLLTLSDSWAHGTELWDPNLGPQKYSFPIEHQEHIDYRNKHAWPGQISKLLGATELINLGWPGCSNDSIMRRLTRWLTNEGYLTGRPANDLMVIIGWTKLDSREFVPSYTDEYEDICNWPYTDDCWVTVQPPSFESNRWEKSHSVPAVDEFSRTYYHKWCNPTEYFHRYINQNWIFQQMMSSIGANWFSYQSVLDNVNLKFDDWKDYNANVLTAKLDPADLILWETIDPKRFYNKNASCCTFHNFLMTSGLPRDVVMYKTHPTEYGHELWANEIFRYMKLNNIV